MQGTWGRGRLRGELDPAHQCLSVPLVARAGRSEEQLPLLSAAWPPSIPAPHWVPGCSPRTAGPSPLL